MNLPADSKQNHSLEIQKSDIDPEGYSDIDNRREIFEFDIHQIIRDQINKLLHRVNLVFGIVELKFIDVRQMFGQINQYVFAQSDNTQCYQIRLANLRRLLDGSKSLSTKKKKDTTI